MSSLFLKKFRQKYLFLTLKLKKVFHYQIRYSLDNYTLLILAGGLSSRYGGASKQMDTISEHGAALLEYAVFDALKTGFTSIVLVLHPAKLKAQQAVFETRFPKGVNITYIAQSPTDLPNQLSTDSSKPLGTGHAVWVARNVISTPFVVINADDFYGRSTLLQAVDFLNKHPNRQGLISFVLENTLSAFGTVSRGICSIHGEILTGITERRKLVQRDGIVSDEETMEVFDSETTRVSMNCWILQPRIFDELERGLIHFIATRDEPEYFLLNAVQKQLEGGETFTCLVSAENWFGLTYEKDKQEAEQRIKVLENEGIYPKKLWL